MASTKANALSAAKHCRQLQRHADTQTNAIRSCCVSMSMLHSCVSTVHACVCGTVSYVHLTKEHLDC
eukprot:m.205452 g.205452  ORF g.205452 m.205452 type:complete len:67 (-) comp22937_c0_seq1:105-305(-)